jgi:hypothetical protein
MLQYNMTTQDLTIDWNDFKAVFKSPETNIAFAEDPVALAWASYRVYLDNPVMRWAAFDTVTVTDQDRAKAQEIRSYYTGRILMGAIKNNGNISEFRKKLYGLLIGETGIKPSEIGILHRLPYFYVEDTALDQVIERTQSAVPLPSSDLAGTFTIIQRILVSRKQGDYVNFWLSHNKRPEPFLIAVKSDNPLLTLLEGILATPVQLSATAHFKHHRGYHSNRHYHQLGNVELAS